MRHSRAPVAMPGGHRERHRSQHTGWLRAAVLGANDGAISTASLLVGVAAAQTGRAAMLVAGLAGMAAGAMSMAAGEYVSVSSQADTERADMALERTELASDAAGEQRELADIYVGRGLTPQLAAEVACRADATRRAAGMAPRDELGLVQGQAARPVQAALASAASFVIGAVVPLLAAWTALAAYEIPVVVVTTLCVLAVLGAVAAAIGGAPRRSGALRVAL